MAEKPTKRPPLDPERWKPRTPKDWEKQNASLLGVLRTLELTREDAKRLSNFLHGALNGSADPPRIGFALVLSPFLDPFECAEGERHIVTNHAPIVAAALLQMAAKVLADLYEAEKDHDRD